VTYDDASRISAFKHINTALDHRFQYDNLDRLTGWSTASTSQTFSYDLVGNRTAQTIGATRYLFDYAAGSNRVASSQFPVPFNYQYDEAGNTTQDALRKYTYDARGRLTQVISGGVTTRYTLNALGQRVSKSPSDGLPRIFHYDVAGHLIEESTPSGEVLREYIYLGDLPVALISSDHDDDGVPDARDNCILDANPDQRDTSAGGIGNVCNGDANGDGVVNQADLLLVITLIHRPGISNPAAAKRADMNGDGKLDFQDEALVSRWINQRGVPGPSGLRGQAPSPEVFYIYADQIGTPRVLVDASNKVRWDWSSADPFGIEPPDEDPQADFISLPFNLRFPGQYYDRESGLHYNGMRDYDPVTGRYVESDPIGLAGGVNTYTYVNGNPLAYYDPYGLWTWGDPLPQQSVDFAGGFGDSLSFGLTGYVRNSFDIGSIDKCSAFYRAGEATDIAFEVGTMGLSAGLKALAANASRKAVRDGARPFVNAFREGNGLDRGLVHHSNPLFGHPGGASTMFPTGGLPARISSSSWNLTWFPDLASHTAAHQRMKGLENTFGALVNPGTTSLRTGRDIADSCGCR
jgi:RHS repeat-associated protein